MFDFFKRIVDERKIAKRLAAVCIGLTDIGLLPMNGGDLMISGTPISIQCRLHSGHIEYFEYTATIDKSKVKSYDCFALMLEKPLLLAYDNEGVYIPEYLMNENGFGLINYALNSLESTLINATAALMAPEETV